MKLIKSEPKRTICSNPDSIFRYFGWPSVARLQDGTLAMGASGFRMKHVCPFGKVIMCYSRNEGKDWTMPAVVLDTILDDRDCGVVPFGKDGVMVTSFNNTVTAQRNWNTGNGSIPEAELSNERKFIEAYLRVVEGLGTQDKYIGSTYRISKDGGYTFGPIMRSPVTAPHGPCALSDGSLMYVGRRFSSNDAFDNGEQPFLQCWHITYDGEWTHLSDIENITEDGLLLNSCEPHTIQLPNGRIIVHIRAQHYGKDKKLFTTYQSISDDNGQTFSKPRRLLDICGGAPAHLMLHSDGTLISAYGYREEPYGIRMMFSKDFGETWDTDWILDDTASSNDVGYPATVELKDGRLLTVYYERTDDGQSVIRQQVWSLPK